jgi:hypothetical protein
MISSREKALLHVYPAAAGLDDVHRREIMQRNSGCVSAADREFTQEGFELTMAAYEAILWDRVERGEAVDPRKCRACGRVLRRVAATIGECPEGCGRRSVCSWSTTYWRSRIPSVGSANTRQLWKLRELWSLLQDYLPETDRSDAYLAAVIAHASGSPVRCPFIIETITTRQAHLAIEAIKDRLSYAVRTAVPF